MIVTVEEVKSALGIITTDDDDRLLRLILAASAWVEKTTLRRFDTPILRTEYHKGNGEAELILNGHIDDAYLQEASMVLLLPTGLQVWSRSRFGGTWQLLEEDTSWERREDTLVFLSPWPMWSCSDEFKIEYYDGYMAAPDDIKAVILELVTAGYEAEIDSASGAASGVTSEHIGDYSYTVDLSAAASVATGGLLSSLSQQTLNNYRRRLA